MPDGQKHLLIVDDETALREAVAERLTEHGFAVEQADSGEQAYRLYGEVRPAVAAAREMSHVFSPSMLG